MGRHAVLNNFYASKIWIDFRAALIAERGPICERCGKTMGNASNLIGHHKIHLTPENVYNHSISLNPDNVEIICKTCHNQVHDRFGNKTEQEVYIVYGCPLSGKTTFVEQHKGRGDIVIDIDRLYKAITFLDMYDKPNRLLNNIKRVRNDLLDQIKVRYGKWQTAWIVMGGADKYRREKLAEDLGAELIYCECTKEEAYARLEIDEDRQSIKNDYKKYIDTWFRRYTAQREKQNICNTKTD